MRAVFLADLHAHTWKAYARTGKGGLNTRLADLRDVLVQVWDESVRRKIKDVYVAGDLLHVKRHIPAQALTVLYEAFDDAKRKGLDVHIISGNHDQVEDDEHANIPKVFARVSQVCAEPWADQQRRVAYVPWQFEQSRVRKFLAGLKGDWQLLLYHGEVHGAFVGPTDYPVALKSKTTLKDLMTEKFEWTMMGHLHRRQMVAERCYYIGNPLPKDRGEPEQDKGAFIVDGNKVDFFVTKHPRFVTLDLSEGPKIEVPAKTKGNFLYLVVPAETDARTLNGMLERMQPREVEVHRAPKAKEREKVTRLRLGQTLEEMFDHYVDEEGGGDPDKKAFGRKLLEDVAEEGASH